jgi:hypothetical protein
LLRKQCTPGNIKCSTFIFVFRIQVQDLPATHTRTVCSISESGGAKFFENFGEAK